MKRNLIIDNIIDSEMIERGATVIIGLSGGPDSLCLLHALYSIADSFELSLVPVHINHKLRKEADAEAEHVAEICDRIDIECRVYEADCKGLAETFGVSTEEAGRELRYGIFDDVADELAEEGVDPKKIVIALAHNADDQSETVLFRLLRGTGARGLAGIPPLRDSARGYTIVRPLLRVERKDIEAYIRENKLHPNIDKTNDENTYTRNKIRNELIPYLEENFNPNIKESLRRYADLAHSDDNMIMLFAFDHIENGVNLDEESGDLIMDVSDLDSVPLAVLSRMAYLMLELLGLEHFSNYELVNSMIGIMISDNPSACINLPIGNYAYREYDRLIFTSRLSEVIKPDIELVIEPKLLMMKDFHPDDGAVYAAFDFDKFNEEHPGRIGDIQLRTRREGDFLPIKGGSKKIQDVFVDSKVIKNARESILMVCIGSEVLWILPSEYFSKEQEKERGKYSPKYHITEDTERVLFIEISESI